jgi:hypothetical protein
LLTEFGHEHRTPLLVRRDLSPELFQFAVDALQLGPGLPFPEVSLAMPGADQFFDLPAEQPQPRISVYLTGPVLELARTNRRDDLVLRQPNSARAVLSLSVAPFRTHSSASRSMASHYPVRRRAGQPT